MEEYIKVIKQYNEEEQKTLFYSMMIADFIGLPFPKNIEDFKKWCEEELKK
jgi:hypothetical protein